MRFCPIFWTSILLAGIAASGNAQLAKPGPLRVGAAKVDITPAQSELPKQYLGVLDPVYSRAIVIDNGFTKAALVSVDVISLSDAICKRLSERIAADLGIPAKNQVLAGVGVHSSPIAVGGRPPQIPAAGSPAAPAPPTPFEDKIFNSVKTALGNLQPARMSFGKGVSYINVNRDNIDPKTHGWWEGPNYDGLSDKQVAVLKFAALNGDPIAVYYNYAVFNVTAGVLDLVSGDVSGAASRYIEDSYDGKVVAAFSLGAHGDQNPIFFQQTFDLREIRIANYAKRGQDIRNAMPPPGGVGLDRNDPKVAKLMNQQKQLLLSTGQMLGEEVLHVVRGTTRELTTAGIYGDQKTVTCPGRQRTNEGRGGVEGTYKDADPVDILVGVLLIGDVAIGEVNANPYTQIGLRFKKESPFANSMMTSRANGVSRGGYIPDDASYGHETFSVLNSALKPGCAETAIVDGIIGMMPRIMY